jgi:ATP-dependent Zn protease
METATLAPVYTTTRELTAWHEAGHAVMAHLCGQFVTGVEIVGDENLTGSVSSLRLIHARHGTDPAVRTARLETRILCLVAGFAAEAIVSDDWDWSAAEDEDLNEAVRLSLRITKRCDKVPRFLEHARDHAVDLLRSNWPAVEAVSRELMKKGRLSGEEFRVMVESWDLVS